MGTRSLTFVYDEDGEKIINLYRQFDGYPTGHGQELAEFLNTVDASWYNGSGCLAAQLVSFFKKEPMNFYLHPTSVEDCGQDYEYHIFVTEGILKIRVIDCGCNFFGETQSDTRDIIFEGSLSEFTAFCNEEETA